MNILEVLEAFAQEVPGFLTCSVVSLLDGTNIGSVGVVENFDPAAADAYFSEVLKKNTAALDSLGLQADTEDVLLTTRSAFFLARALPETPYFWNVITTRRGSLGFTRALMRKYEARIVQTLP
ncbi:MAG: hypothetical protein CMH57_10070 [Myxococcales bacterium]|nr:hypothetical protein [Myxococcales bacterium]